MAIMVKYVPETAGGPGQPPVVGQIVNVWHATPASWLEAQVPSGDTTGVYQQLETDLDPRVILMDYYMLGATLTAKEVLTMTASPNPFAADGVTICQVSVAPFVPCTLLIGTTSVALTAADQVAEVTSTTAQMLQVTLEPMTQYRADPPILIVEAQ